MSRKDLYNSSNEMNDELLEQPETAKQKGKNIWIKWGAVVICFCIVVVGIMVWHRWYELQHPMLGEHCGLPGEYEIYPTVMVEGEFYEWYKGAAICKKLPEDCVFYGEINQTKEKIPQNDCEFVSVFWAVGEIYTTPDEDCVYLKLTTDWLDDTVVKFDFVKRRSDDY